MDTQTTSDSPSALLERAAAHVEALAAQATPGPWRHHDTHLNHGGHTATVLTGEGDDTRLLAWLPSFSHDHWQQDRNVWSDSRWIAALSPAVAYPLVEWLRETVELYRAEHSRRMVPAQALDEAWTRHPAVRFARHVLGEPSDVL